VWKRIKASSAKRPACFPDGWLTRRAARGALGLVVPLVATTAIACDATSEERVTAQLVDGALVLQFERACQIGYLRLTTPPSQGDTAPRMVWEVVADREAPVAQSITVGVPPDGFREQADDTRSGFSGPITLFVKDVLIFTAEIATAELADGSQHAYVLRQAMNEMVPPEPRC
jgi:hypothetical protein